MKDIEKILVEILLCITAAIFVLLLFNSCKSQKNIIKTQIDSTATEVVKVESHTTDNSKSEEDYMEITYVLDSGQIVTIGQSVTNCNQLRVSQIKVKTSHIKHENNIDSKIYAEETKTAEIKEKTHTIEKENPATGKKYFFVGIAFAFAIICLFLWRFYRRI